MNVSDISGENLKKIRLALKLSQRELAKEFKVSGAAIAQWETGARTIPGPILKLMEIYSEYLGAELESSDVVFMRNLSTSWTKRITTALSGPKIIDPKLHEGLQNSIYEFLKNNLSNNEVGRRIQLNLLERVVAAVGTSKGLPMKAVQMITYLNPSISDDLREILYTLLENQPHIAPSIVARIIYEDFGASPRELFSSWDPKPFASASIGQVHRARLKTGEYVAVKVQYPDIRKSIESDLKIFSLLEVIAHFFKSDSRQVLQDVQRVIKEECDYSLEAMKQEKVREATKNIPHVFVPKVYFPYSSQRVLTTEYVEGKTLREFSASASQSQRDQAGTAVWKYSAVLLLQHHIFNGDHNSGNFLFTDSGVYFLDFGRAIDVDPNVTPHHIQMLNSLIDDDRLMGKDAVRKLNFVRNWDYFDFDEFWDLMRVQQRHCTNGETFRFSRDYLIQSQRYAKSYSGQKNLRVTSDVLWNTCSTFGTGNILATLKAEANWTQLLCEVIR